MSGLCPGPYTVKYRSDTTDNPKLTADNEQRCSPASSVTPYGLNGCNRVDSSTGYRSAFP